MRKWSLAVLLVLTFSLSAQAQQSSGTLRGKVADEFGGLIIGATVTVADQNGVEKTTTTDAEGNYAFPSLPPGRYTLRATAPGFSVYENTELEVTAGRTVPLDLVLSVAVEQAEVTITAESPISTEPENNAGALVLRGEDLEALPDDPDDLSDALQALAGPSAGLEGGETYIDGFSGGRLPPKESIREIRINRNPFSAEYDRLGFGRIEIFTKPGTDKLRGQLSFNFGDEILNSRNPFAVERAQYQTRRYGGNLSGPLSSKKASFFIDVERREVDDNHVIKAVILDPAFNPIPFSDVVLGPSRRTTISPRLDYQLNANNTLVARYTYTRSSNENSGVGDFNLASRAYDTSNQEHTLQITETALINQKIINETRFQYIRRRTKQEAQDNSLIIRVSEAFTGGGAQTNLAANDEDRFELQNFTSWTAGQHSLKAGIRVRGVHITDISQQNFAGTYTFGGGAAPQLDGNNQIVIDPVTGLPVLVQITSIERYRRTLLLGSLGLTPAEVRLRGGGATQFSISGGNPEASVSQYDFSPFIQDDWRIRPNFTLSLGLRYEKQTNISDALDFAPRVAFAWSPGAGAQGRQQRMVIRGGFGIFYDRFRENLTLQANRFDGLNQQQFVVTVAQPNGAAILDSFPNPPSAAALEAFNVPQTIRQVAADLQSPYTLETSLSVERQLVNNVTLSVSYIGARTLHVLRSRNINAPINGVRPIAGVGNIFQYESSGRFNQNQLIVNFNNRLSRKFTLFSNYVLNYANGDTDGANTFPANQYDLSSEYGRSSVDVRHRISLGGSINALPWGVRLNPFVNWNSGRPFNITTGRDINADSLFTDRPALATDLSQPGVIVTRYGAFVTNPLPGQEIIPRNFGAGPSFFAINLRISKAIGFGPELSATPRGGAGGGRGGGGRGGGGRGGRGGGGGFGGGGDGESTGKRYNLTLSVNIQNLLNHTNLGTPVGNLTSPVFGLSNTTAGGFGGPGGGANQSAGNRRIELQARFSF
ncbi:MAG TPA: carboxypeptidase regulatory-like domain-containing protein [Pyrinomonadaceae bacterium]|nr:carboxypeptidase regulatory-like domain-containing protein [Pyrinomonadaceae bacterium]